MTTYLYAIGNRFGPIKIGISHSPERRVEQFKTACPFPIRVIHVEPCDSREIAFSDEAFGHQFLAEKRLWGEWFDIDWKVATDVVKATVHYGKHFRERAA